MPDLLNIGTSGLLTYQRALNTTSHNIANVNTDGYSRQSSEIQANVPSFQGGLVFGNGSRVQSITRAFDNLLATELRDNLSTFNRSEAFSELAGNIDDLLADPQGGLSPLLIDFFGSVQDLAEDPASTTARIAMIDTAQVLTNRFANFDLRFQNIDENTTVQIRNVVSEINTLVEGIKDINLALQDTTTSGQLTEQSADLLDRRDALLNELAGLVDITVVNPTEPALSVFVGNGQALLNGATSFSLQTQPDPRDPTRDIIAYSGLTAAFDISSQINQGELGALLRFREQVLDPTRNSVGRLAIGLAETFNAQMRDGMDLNGNLGTDFFSYSQPQVIDNAGNAGTATISAVITDVTALSTDDYLIEFDGANWNLTSDSGTTASVANGTPATLAFEGFTLTINGAGAVLGDRFTIKPTLSGARTLDVVTSNPDEIAAAAPIRTETSLSNLGDVTISPGVVTDVTDANLLTPVTIRFTAANTFDVVGAVPPQVGVAYTNNMTVSANGWQVTLSGTPQAFDELTIESNAGGSGDNRNMLLLGALETTGVFDGGRASYQEDYATLVGVVGRQTQAALIETDANESLLIQARDRRLELSGVNLDEEAADLVRYQQAYEANARIISVAQTIFDTLLQSVR